MVKPGFEMVPDTTLENPVTVKPTLEAGGSWTAGSGDVGVAGGIGFAGDGGAGDVGPEGGVATLEHARSTFGTSNVKINKENIQAALVNSTKLPVGAHCFRLIRLFDRGRSRPSIRSVKKCLSLWDRIKPIAALKQKFHVSN